MNVHSGLDGTLENSADSCESLSFFLFFDGMLLQIINKMEMEKNRSGLEVGVSLCAQEFPPNASHITPTTQGILLSVFSLSSFRDIMIYL